jgi:flagellar assembly protein FliH
MSSSNPAFVAGERAVPTLSVLDPGSRLIGESLVAGPTVRVEDLPPRQPAFSATYAAPRQVAEIARLPRNWSEFEGMVQSRLQQFEERHLQECQGEFERGRLEGRREQEAEVIRRLEAAAGPWRTLQATVLKELAAGREELYRAATELSAALARAWLGKVVEINPHAFEAGIQQALDALGEQDQLEVRLNPTDYARYCEGLKDPEALLSEAHAFTVSPDPQVDPGGAIATCRGGTADARLAVRVQKALEWLDSPYESR